ncbi:MAG: UvrD-helicase domain-containing protein [Bacteroidales bacterium]|nr:UvrD-helicase domain-containing protein [Bacteroidales bacterium]MCM1147250.1 UvrD-helicase domain-containing protein [Bacteroidales bacterium]MCM1206317.1 UvrD-helicase domain-containing protein [Bacillota bacterium]MCM1510494.1 UvrD-helicase domain-containing protein [Clostridium sp.]
MNLSELNDSQREAVEYCEGPSLVIAGAGSGKTRVLTYKIAYLIEQGYEPWSILALTFTNKAANEMKQRIGQLVGDDTARFLNMGTFHSVFSRILRAEAPLIGYSSSFTIYDENDSRSLLKSIVSEFGLDDKIYKPAAVHNRISMAKNNIELPENYAADSRHAARDKDARMERMPRIYEEYQKRLRQSNAMDFDDLLLYTYILFDKNRDICEKYGKRFQFVLVDEYQDTNAVQQKIVLQIVRDHKKICVVGDDAQSIYGFRGANIDNILDFRQKFGGMRSGREAEGATSEEGGARLFKLERNYRSTQSIVQAANSLIGHNQRQIKKTVYSDNDKGDKLQLKYCYSDREEAVIVAKDIRRIMRSEGLHYGDFAILYRTNAQSRTFEEQFRKDNMPYRIYGGLSFYQRKEIKDVVAYLRLVVNLNDEEALRRIINYPARGIGKTTVDKVLTLARQLEMSPWEIVKSPVMFGLDVNKGTMAKLVAFAEMIGGFAESADTEDAHALGKRIIMESGVSKDIYSGADPEDISRQENLQEFMDSLQEFVDIRREEDGEEHIMLNDFLQEISLLSDLDSDDDNKLSHDSMLKDDKVTLMTIHSAKGLEFPAVFVVGMEENIFPSSMCNDSQRAIEEERRLFYVAITRAEKHCILTSAQNRYRYGKPEFCTPSRFLNDIDPMLVDVHDFQYADSTSPWSSKGRTSWSGTGKPFGENAPEWMSGGRTFQNSHPVASQFRADRKPKITGGMRNDASAGIFSPELKEEGRQASTFSGRRMTRIGNTFSGNNENKIVRSSSVSASGQASSADASHGFGNLTVGMRIEHERFGIGTILKIEGKGENTKATVEFQHCGTKQLLLKFAKFKRLS